MAKKKSKAVEAAINARIQRAVTGFVIPMMSIPLLSRMLKDEIAAEASDADLKAIVAAFPGIVPSSI